MSCGALQNAGSHTSWIDVHCLLRLHFQASARLARESVVKVETKVGRLDTVHSTHQLAVQWQNTSHRPSHAAVAAALSLLLATLRLAYPRPVHSP